MGDLMDHQAGCRGTWVRETVGDVEWNTNWSEDLQVEWHYVNLHSLKLTWLRPWKWMVGRWWFPFGMAQTGRCELLVSGREVPTQKTCDKVHLQLFVTLLNDTGMVKSYQKKACIWQVRFGVAAFLSQGEMIRSMTGWSFWWKFRIGLSDKKHQER